MEKKRSAESTIAGYLYQFDKTILEILKEDNEQSKIYIEGIEDIDFQSLGDEKEISMQIKYYAAQSYSPSSIKEAIQAMFINFKKIIDNEQPRRNYQLYAHFKSGQEKLNLNNGNLIDQEETAKDALNFLKEDLLTNKNKAGEVVTCLYKIDGNMMPDELLKEFIDLLFIDINARDIDEQFKELKEIMIEKVNNCKDKVEAEEYYYNNALKIIFNKATQRSEEGIELEGKCKELRKQIKTIKNKISKEIEKGSTESELSELKQKKQELEDNANSLLEKAQDSHREERSITKGDFLNLIDKKVFFFNKWFAWHKGKQNYYQYIIDKLKNAKALSQKKHRYLLIGKKYLNEANNSISFGDLIYNIVEDSYAHNKALSDNKVWTVILEAEKEEIIELKKEILEKGIQFNDGNETIGNFSLGIFNKEPILNINKNSIIVDSSYQIKIITLENFLKYSDQINNLDVLISFGGEQYADEILEIKSASKYIIEETKGICGLDDLSRLFNSNKHTNHYFRVLSVAPTSIQIEVTNPDEFRNANDKFALGSYIRIADEFDESVIGILRNYKIRDLNDYSMLNSIKKQPSFILDIHPIGYMKNGEFYRGTNNITIPPSHVEILEKDLLKLIFEQENKKNEFVFSSLPQSITSNEKIKVTLDGNKFFNKHLAVLGSTGSGKSCTVAKILHEGIAPFSQDQKQDDSILNNSHIIIFDMHGEYHQSFGEKSKVLSADDLMLPYWMMNSLELEEFFLDVEGSDHNQRTLFKKAVIANKKYHNKDETGEFKTSITYDTPVFFNIAEVLQYFKNYNLAKDYEGEIIFSTDGENRVTDSEDYQKDGTIFKPLKAANKGTKSSTYNAKLTGFINRLETKINDERLSFILNRGKEFKIDFAEVIRQILGYGENNKNVIIIDLSGIAFEIVNNIVSVISRLVFQFAFHKKKLNPADEVKVPFLLVYEEAHNYIPRSTEAKYKAVKNSVERVAKEGRKYGVSVMIVSQRPSEISETIFSQCNSFVVMRITNPNDQDYVKRLLPDDVSSLTESLSSFKQCEALIIGEAISMPAIVNIDKLEIDKLPKSNDVHFVEKWREDWYVYDEFEDVIKNIEKS